MNDHSFNVLEFNGLLELISRQAQSAPGRKRVLGLRPSNRREQVAARRGLYENLLSLHNLAQSLPSLQLEDLQEIMREVAPEGAVLAGQELLAIRGLLETVIAVVAFVQRQECESLLHLRQLVSGLEPCESLYNGLQRSLDVDGSVLDTASAALRDLRRQVNILEQRIQRHLEQILRQDDKTGALQEKFITVRNGRYVVPVRREARQSLPGLVHDLSNSGQTLFVEPLSTLESGNELARMRLEERDEVRRILASLSAQARDQLGALRGNQRLLADLDAASAVVRWAVSYHCVLPAFGDELHLRGARHPLLQEQLRQRGQEDNLVPLDLELPPATRTLVITGSNTGGKTVALKTIGLLCLAAQTGLPVPAADESLFPLYDEILADIGDEQSIQANLSTFSAHVRNIGKILEASQQSRSLVLLDELGSGTDPLEGGALACAILSELSQSKGLVVATTHLGVVKAYVHSQPRMLNAAVRFNVNTLAPEFALDIGRPGASHAMSIAKKLGLPNKVLRQAEEMMSGDQLRLEDMITQMEKDQKKISTHAVKLAAAEQGATSKHQELKKELDELRQERKKILHQAAQQAQAMVENTRKEMENLLRGLREEVKKAQSEQPRGRKADQPGATLDLATVRARLAERERKLQVGLRQTGEKPRQALPAAELVAGNRVWVEKLKGHGVLEGLFDEGSKAAVNVNGILFTCKVSELQAPRGAEAPRDAGTVKFIMPRAQGSTPSEVNLLGMRVDEAIGRLDDFINQSIMARLPEVRVIHGFGTGRLRNGIHEWLRKHALVKSFRLGKDGTDPGGNGCTIVAL